MKRYAVRPIIPSITNWGVKQWRNPTQRALLISPRPSHQNHRPLQNAAGHDGLGFWDVPAAKPCRPSSASMSATPTQIWRWQHHGSAQRKLLKQAANRPAAGARQQNGIKKQAISEMDVEGMVKPISAAPCKAAWSGGFPSPIWRAIFCWRDRPMTISVVKRRGKAQKRRSKNTIKDKISRLW